MPVWVRGKASWRLSRLPAQETSPVNRSCRTQTAGDATNPRRVDSAGCRVRAGHGEGVAGVAGDCRDWQSGPRGATSVAENYLRYFAASVGTGGAASSLTMPVAVWHCIVPPHRPLGQFRDYLSRSPPKPRNADLCCVRGKFTELKPMKRHCALCRRYSAQGPMPSLAASH